MSRALGHRGAGDVDVRRIHDHRVVRHQAMVREHAFPSQVIENALAGAGNVDGRVLAGNQGSGGRETGLCGKTLY